MALIHSPELSDTVKDGGQTIQLYKTENILQIAFIQELETIHYAINNDKHPVKFLNGESGISISRKSYVTYRAEHEKFKRDKRYESFSCMRHTALAAVNT